MPESDFEEFEPSPIDLIHLMLSVVDFWMQKALKASPEIKIELIDNNREERTTLELHLHKRGADGKRRNCLMRSKRFGKNVFYSKIKDIFSM